MMENNKAQEIIQEFFVKFGFDVSVRILEFKDNTFFVKVNAPEAKFLIGTNGEILIDIQSVLSKIIQKESKEQLYVDLDVNDYKEHRLKYIKGMAKDAADEVAQTRFSKELPPLSAYERRIVHMELAQREDILTESVGQGEDRRVVVKPK